MSRTEAAARPGVGVPTGAGRASGGGPAHPRAVRIGGREYRVILPSIRDPRLHVAVVLLTLQALGQTVLGFRLSVAQILACLAAGALVEFSVSVFKDKTFLWPASGLLTGNSSAFILRVPGTVHGDWWSMHGIWIFIGVVAISMASKYLIRWRGRHIFNPSNLGLVVAFVALGPRYTEPLDLWWAPMGPWMIVAYAILIAGGLLIALELRLLGLELGFIAGFAAFLYLALASVPDHCMVASWHATPMCGLELWKVLFTSPEVLVFALFMIPDPRTVPDGPVTRIVFGVVAALLAVVLLGPTTLEFWTKTAILASLVIACSLRFALARAFAHLEPGASTVNRQRPFWPVAATIALVLLFTESLPAAASLSTHSPEPAPELPDGSSPTVTLKVSSGPGLAAWMTAAAEAALPPVGKQEPGAAWARIWVLPSIPAVSIPANVTAFDPSMAPQVAARMGHDVVLDLIVESEARRSHDSKLAATAADGEALKEFTDVINQDVSAGTIVQKTYSFDQASLGLWLPKFSTQAPRLIGVTLHGTATLTTRDVSGNVLSQTSAPYSKSWGLGSSPNGGSAVIANDYTDLTPA